MTQPNPPTSAEAVVLVEGLRRSFGDQTAVDGLDLAVRPGECLGLLGPNGAGKSTTVRILSTLLRPDAGVVRVLGQDLTRSNEASLVRRRIGVVPQHLAIYDRLSARENLSFFAGLQGLAGVRQRAAVDRGLALAGLEERAKDPVASFSGGMKRRLNVAAALVHRPELVFLDEPTVGVDPQSRNRIYEMVESLRERGMTTIYTSHQLGEVERLCDRIVILDGGKNVAGGSLRELQEHPDVRRGGAARLCFADVDAARAAAERLSSFAFELEEERPDLEQVFLDLTGHALRDEVAS